VTSHGDNVCSWVRQQQNESANNVSDAETKAGWPLKCGYILRTGRELNVTWIVSTRRVADTQDYRTTNYESH